MYKKILITLVVIANLSGCGTLVGMRADAAKFDFVATKSNTETTPIKSDRFNTVKTIVVADFSRQMGSEYPADNKRLYKAAVKEIELLLSETGRFKVLPITEYRKKLVELDIDLDLTTIDEEELRESLSSVGKALDTHAVVSFSLETVGDVTSMSSQFKGMGQLLMDGALTLNMITGIEFLASKDSEVLWNQKSDVQWKTGTQGLKTTTNKELRTKLRVALAPMLLSTKH